MRKRMLCVYLLLLWLMIAVSVTAQEEVTDTVYSAVDTAVEVETEDEDYSEKMEIDTLLSSNVIYFSKDSLRKFRNEKDFAYINVPLDSLLKKRQERQPKQVPQTARRDSSISFGDIIRFLIWLAVIGGVLFLIYRLFLSEKGLFAAPQQRKKLTTEEDEPQDDDSFAKRIADAEKKGAYRIAVRYQYLQVLHSLAAKGWLQLSPDKTNYQYLRELSGKPIRQNFARITLHYDYAWYGNFEVDASVYQTIKNEFSQFQTTMKQ
jgi:Domain of unknown function (DUF4129)